MHSAATLKDRLNVFHGPLASGSNATSAAKLQILAGSNDQFKDQLWLAMDRRMKPVWEEPKDHQLPQQINHKIRSKSKHTWGTGVVGTQLCSLYDAFQQWNKIIKVPAKMKEKALISEYNQLPSPGD